METGSIDRRTLLLTPRDAAHALSISERALWQRTANGEIPRVRIGRSVRYRPAALLAYAKRMEGQK